MFLLCVFVETITSSCDGESKRYRQSKEGMLVQVQEPLPLQLLRTLRESADYHLEPITHPFP